MTQNMLFPDLIKSKSFCERCNKKLTNPKSIKERMGPICRHKAFLREKGIIMTDQEILYNNQEPIHEFKDDIICKRNPFYINIPQKLIYHSPSGMEWSYGGSGPADLALNILALFVSNKRAMELHQSFKWEFVSSLPKEGGVIKNSEIRKWIEEQNALPEMR